MHAYQQASPGPVQPGPRPKASSLVTIFQDQYRYEHVNNLKQANKDK